MLTLQVSLDQFIVEFSRRMSGETAYVHERSSDVVVSAAALDASIRLIAVSGLPKAEVEQKLHEAQIAHAHGIWRSDDDALNADTMADFFVASVAYRSSEMKPGLWIDAYPHEPTVQEVLQNLYTEFEENGEIADVSFEDFLRLAAPNVEVLAPDQVRYFVRRKLES